MQSVPTSLQSCAKSAGAAVVCASAAATLMALPDSAQALDLDNEGGLVTETVASRERLKDYDNIKKYGAERVSDRDRNFAQPDGIRAGNYVILPSLDETLIYDDNIFRSDANRVSDFRNELTPEVHFQSHLPRHLLDFSLAGRIVSYVENSDQDYANLRANLQSALHFDHAHTLSLSALSAIEHEERGELLTPLTAAEPVELYHNRAALGLTRDVGRLYGTISGSFERWDYTDTKSISGTMLDLDARDTDQWVAQIKLGYRISPGYELIAKVRGLRELNRGDEDFDRDAVGYEALAGVAFETNPLLRWRLLGGYGVRDFDQPNLDTVASALIEGRMQWLPTQTVTVYADLSHEIVSANGPEDNGRLETALRGKVEYELYHNLLLTADLEIKEADFIGSERRDREYSGRIGLDYFPNKNLVLSIGYEHAIRDSTEDVLDMTRNRIMVGAKLRY
ncbi:MAG: outer membrane beta-barrel protein [Pseudomonadota bacterium]